MILSSGSLVTAKKAVNRRSAERYRVLTKPKKLFERLAKRKPMIIDIWTVVKNTPLASAKLFFFTISVNATDSDGTYSWFRVEYKKTTIYIVKTDLLKEKLRNKISKDCRRFVNISSFLRSKVSTIVAANGPKINDGRA
jgi:hypothetical protein